jgi:hypothetical protein
MRIVGASGVEHSPAPFVAAADWMSGPPARGRASGNVALGRRWGSPTTAVQAANSPYLQR